MSPQQSNNGWEPVQSPNGWEPVGATEATPTGISVPKGMIGGSIGDVAKAGGSRIRDYMKSLDPRPTEEEEKLPDYEKPFYLFRRGMKGFYEGEKEAAGQVKEQVKGAKAAAGVGDLGTAALRGGQAVTTGLSMLDPLATGPE